MLRQPRTKLNQPNRNIFSMLENLLLNIYKIKLEIIEKEAKR